MTSLWRICSSALLLTGVCAAGTTISGTVRLQDSKDPAVRKHRDYSGVVVWLERVNGARPVPAEPKHTRMLQKDKAFVPHVLAIPVGSMVDFPNLDPIFHNAFSNYDGQVFDVGLYPPGTSRTVRFARPGIVRVFCNIHANMSAVIAVLDTPWYDVTAPDGSFKFSQVLPGEYQLHVYHERATAATLDALSRKFTVHDEPVALPPIAISESGYLSIPHKNKYGHDYPPAPDAAGTYPAVR